MEIYLVKGYLSYSYDNYMETVTVFEMDEKPKSYVAKHTRVNKSEIGIIQQHLSGSSYKVYVTSKADVEIARRQIKEKIQEYIDRELQKYQNWSNALAKHTLDSPVPGFVR